jgi:hypothetical protein
MQDTSNVTQEGTSTETLTTMALLYCLGRGSQGEHFCRRF